MPYYRELDTITSKEITDKHIIAHSSESNDTVDTCSMVSFSEISSEPTCFIAYKHSVQVVPSGIDTYIIWETADVELDTASGYHAGNQCYVVQTPGKYLVSVTVKTEGHSWVGGDFIRLFLYNSHSNLLAHRQHWIYSWNDEPKTMSLDAVFYFHTGDLIRPAVNFWTGGTVSLNTYFNRLSIKGL